MIFIFSDQIFIHNQWNVTEWNGTEQLEAASKDVVI